MLRILSISTLFPSPARPSFGLFVASQMRAVVALGMVDLVMINPIGIPPWPLSRRQPYATYDTAPAQSDVTGIPVHHPRFTLIPRLGADSNPRRIIRAIWPLVRRLHAQQPFDLVDAQFFFPDGPVAAEIARRLGLPHTIKARGSDILLWSTSPAALPQILKAGRSAAALLTVSQALGRDMAALGLPESRIITHYTGLDHSRFRLRPRAEARAALPFALPPEAPLLVTPGSLIAIKGQELAIQALTHLPSAHLALAGAGPDEAALRALTARLGLTHRVHFLGQVNHDTLPILMAAAQAIVLPSEREGLANVWVEALACGAPLVIPPIGGAAEILTAPTAGRIAARDPQAIAQAVQDVLAAALPPEHVATHAAGYTWENNARNLVRIWQDALTA